MVLTRIRLPLALLAFVLIATPGTPATHYTIGTGSKGATFYPMAVALCEQISILAHGFSCEAVESPGSKYNLQGLERGEFDLVLSQVSLQYQAWRGDAPFDTPHQNLRTVSSLHREIFILAVQPELDVSSLAALRGARLNIGNVGSGSRVITERMLSALEFDQADFTIHSSASSGLPQLFCSGSIDAAIYSTGHPNAIYRQLVEECGVQLVNLWNAEIAAFVESSWELTRAEIPGGTYKGITVDRSGFGIQTVISAHRNMPPQHVAKILEVLQEQREVLAEKVPVYRDLGIDGEALVFAAPYHPGVEQYLGGETPK